MHPLSTFGVAWNGLKQYTKSDWQYVLLFSFLILIFLAVSIILLPTRMDPSGHIAMPAGLWLLSVIASRLTSACVFFTLAFRSHASLMNKPIVTRAVVRSIAAYITPAIAVFICAAIFYFVPLVLILAFPFSIADRAVRNQLVTVAVKFYSGIVSFGMMYSLPLLIVERQIGFRNVLSSLGQSLKEPVLTVLLVLPTYILGLFQLLLTQNSATGVALRFLQACVSYFVVLLAFFLYASFVNLKYNRSPKAL